MNTTMDKNQLIEAPTINTRSAELAAIEAETMLSEVKSVVIKTADDRKEVIEKYFNASREAAKNLEVERKKISVPLNNALDALNALFKRPANYFKEVRDTAESKCLEYDRKVQAAIDEENRRIREAAAKEEARQRAIKEEQERVWREKEAARQREAEELARQARESNNAKERARLEAEAEKSRQEAAKAAEKAAERAQQAAEVFVPAPVIQQEKQKVSGSKDITRWDFEITDMNLIPREWFVLDESKIGKFASATKGTVSIPGIRIFPVKKLA